MTIVASFPAEINTLSAGVWLLICGGASVLAAILFVILCRVGASISDVPAGDGESL